MTIHDSQPVSGLKNAENKVELEADSAEAARVDLYQGLGNTLAVAFEFVATPAIFGVIGYFIDRAAGTTPLFLITLLLFGIIGMSVKMWFGYDHAMRLNDKDSAWTRARSTHATKTAENGSEIAIANNAPTEAEMIALVEHDTNLDPGPSQEINMSGLRQEINTSNS